MSVCTGNKEKEEGEKATWKEGPVRGEKGERGCQEAMQKKHFKEEGMMCQCCREVT